MLASVRSTPLFARKRREREGERERVRDSFFCSNHPLCLSIPSFYHLTRHPISIKRLLFFCSLSLSLTHTPFLSLSNSLFQQTNSLTLVSFSSPSSPVYFTCICPYSPSTRLQLQPPLAPNLYLLLLSLINLLFSFLFHSPPLFSSSSISLVCPAAAAAAAAVNITLLSDCCLDGVLISLHFFLFPCIHTRQT